MNESNKTLAIINHVLGIFTGFLGPLIILLVSSDKTVKLHAKKALNWQFSVLIYGILSGILVFLLIGIPLLIILSVLNVIFPIIAAIKAGEGKIWDYPISIKFFN